MTPIRILLVDDHAILRDGLRAILSTQPDMTVVGETESGIAAIALFREHKPDVTLMDLRLPGQSGLDAIVAIRAEFPSARIIVLTTYDGNEDIYRALKQGAQGFLTKDLLRKELLEAIRTVHQGGRYLSSGAAARLAERLPQSDLTPRELEVLREMVRGHTNKTIAAVLGAAEGTIRIHVSNILAKLGASDRTEAAVVAVRQGIIHLE